MEILETIPKFIKATKKERLTCAFVDASLSEQEKFEQAIDITGLPVDCSTFKSYNDFYKFLEQTPLFVPDYIFLDWPEINGEAMVILEFLKTNSLYSKVPKIIYSDPHYLNDIGRLKKLGIKTFITKPMELLLLAAKLSKILKF